MKNLILSILLLLICNFSFGQEKESPKLGEKIFVLFTTDPCGPCERFKSEILRSPLKDKISKMFSNKYILKNTEVSKEWKSYFDVVSPKTFPTSAIFEYDGKNFVFLDKKIGFSNKEEIISWF